VLVNYWKLSKEGRKIYDRIEKFNNLHPSKKIFLRKAEYDTILEGIDTFYHAAYREFIPFKETKLVRI
jgi:hypothetical protein